MKWGYIKRSPIKIKINYTDHTHDGTPYHPNRRNILLFVHKLGPTPGYSISRIRGGSGGRISEGGYVVEMGEDDATVPPTTGIAQEVSDSTLDSLAKDDENFGGPCGAVILTIILVDALVGHCLVVPYATDIFILFARGVKGS
ncbi:hypothetical protein GUJ93_ZPchr0009g466 [Zizania palustris]|uniref:Uncharacterized protein n=1 Tax=Zizania palustris TaxID=103762 RepID=A0A8J5R1F9_ZIZPA|nr:hypothetical protein GUJ93_ZPchr0009g466 [Zizania palustris]